MVFGVTRGLAAELPGSKNEYYDYCCDGFTPTDDQRTTGPIVDQLHFARCRWTRSNRQSRGILVRRWRWRRSFNTLWNRVIRFDPQDPIWPNRDRFVLSNG